MYHGVSENFEHLIFMDGKLSAKSAVPKKIWTSTAQGQGT